MDVQTTSNIFILCVCRICLILWHLRNSHFYFRIFVSRLTNLKLNIKIIDSMRKCIEIMNGKLHKLMEKEVVNAKDIETRCIFMVAVKKMSENFLCTCVENMYSCPQCGNYKCKDHLTVEMDETLHIC